VILGGKWLELTEQDIEPATGSLVKYLIGYDSQQQPLVEFNANDFGAATYTSEGMAGPSFDDDFTGYGGFERRLRGEPLSLHRHRRRYV
jgi:hypothetical protein